MGGGRHVIRAECPLCSIHAASGTTATGRAHVTRTAGRIHSSDSELAVVVPNDRVLLLMAPATGGIIVFPQLFVRPAANRCSALCSQVLRLILPSRRTPKEGVQRLATRRRECDVWRLVPCVQELGSDCCAPFDTVLASPQLFNCCAFCGVGQATQHLNAGFYFGAAALFVFGDTAAGIVLPRGRRAARCKETRLLLAEDARSLGHWWFTTYFESRNVG